MFSSTRTENGLMDLGRLLNPAIGIGGDPEGAPETRAEQNSASHYVSNPGETKIRAISQA
jgi:hypothetical protein